MELAGKVAVVTGAGRRLGRAIALGLAERGCDLMVHYYRSREAALATAADLRRLGVQAFTVQADLREIKDVRGLFQEVDKTLGGVDFLVNSAAGMTAGTFLTTTESEWDTSIDLNLKAPFFCLQEAAKRMQARGGGAVVNLSDVAALRPWTGFPVHSVSKAGLEMLTKIAAKALAPSVRVNAVAPGPILPPDDMDDLKWGRLLEALPLGRSGEPADIVATVIFLLENDYITGETLVVDGGRQLL